MNGEELRRIADARIEEALDRASRGHRRARAKRIGRQRRARLTAPVVTVGTSVGRWALVLAKAVARAWRANAELQEMLYESEHPWEHEGPLRWRGRRSHARLVGCHLPAPTEGGTLDGRADQIA